MVIAFCGFVGTFVWLVACAFEWLGCEHGLLRLSIPWVLGFFALLALFRFLSTRWLVLLTTPQAIRIIERGGFRANGLWKQ